MYCNLFPFIISYHFLCLWIFVIWNYGADIKYLNSDLLLETNRWANSKFPSARFWPYAFYEGRAAVPKNDSITITSPGAMHEGGGVFSPDFPACLSIPGPEVFVLNSLCSMLKRYRLWGRSLYSSLQNKYEFIIAEHMIVKTLTVRWFALYRLSYSLILNEIE
jgi:hypothetical protein